jgi:hypothetical protein
LLGAVGEFGCTTGELDAAVGELNQSTAEGLSAVVDLLTAVTQLHQAVAEFTAAVGRGIQPGSEGARRIVELVSELLCTALEFAQLAHGRFTETLSAQHVLGRREGIGDLLADRIRVQPKAGHRLPDQLCNVCLCVPEDAQLVDDLGDATTELACAVAQLDGSEIELPQTVGQCEDTVRGGIDTGRELRCTAGKSGCAVTCGNHVVCQSFRARRQFAGSGIGSVHSGRELECSVGGLLQTCTRIGQSDQNRLDGLRADLVADLTENLLGGILTDDGAEVVVDVVEGELQLRFVGVLGRRGGNGLAEILGQSEREVVRAVRDSLFGFLLRDQVEIELTGIEKCLAYFVASLELLTLHHCTAVGVDQCDGDLVDLTERIPEGPQVHCAVQQWHQDDGDECDPGHRAAGEPLEFGSERHSSEHRGYLAPSWSGLVTSWSRATASMGDPSGSGLTVDAMMVW